MSTAAWPSSACKREGMALPGAGGSDAQCCARLCRQQSQECAGMPSSVAEQTAEIVRSISCPLQHGPTCGREGLALPGAGGSDAQCCARICRQQSQECGPTWNAVQSLSQTAEIVRSISCPLLHGPACGREGMALPGAGGSDAQCCARICRQQSQECAGMLCSR